MNRDIAEAVLWFLLVVALVLGVLLIRERQANTRLRRRIARLGEEVTARDEEIGLLAAVRLPAVLDPSGRRQGAGDPLDPHLVGTPFAASLAGVIDLFGRTTENARARADTSAKAALKSSMRALQGLANEQQLAISEMQDRHDDPDVLADLLEIDHTNSQFGRRAQAIAVLCGSWPGRQRAASPLVDVVRGATSRIRDYRRVQVYSQLDVAVTSRAVEPVVLAIAELLDNAARHSQPNTSVQVNLQHAHNGVAVVIDDAGVGLLEQEVRRAEELLAGRQSVDIQQLGDPPQFGFAVIGILSERYGFRVSVDTRSPYGGVRAVVFLPSALLTRIQDGAPTVLAAPPAAPAPPARQRAAAPQPPAPPAARPVEAPAEHSPAQPVEHSQPAEASAATAAGLPKRRRRSAADPAPPPAPRAAEAAGPQGRSAREAAAVVGAFARGTRSGRSSVSDTPDAPDTSDSPETPEHEGNTPS